MNYYFTTQKEDSFENIIVRVTDELKKEGFGIITEINVTETFKNKLDVDFKNYRILGACNPNFAHQVLSIDEKIGVMLPCNVIVSEIKPGLVEVTAIDPHSSMQMIENDKLTELAVQVGNKLKNVIDNL